MRRSGIDWEAIERDYRLGQFSDRELAKHHDVSQSAISRRAAKYSWIKDLRAEVSVRTQAALVPKASESISADVRARDLEAVERAALTQVMVVREHRMLLARGRGLIGKLLDELEQATNNIDDIRQAIEEATATDKTRRRPNSLLKAVGLRSRAQAIASLSTAMQNFISKEREAFGLKQRDLGDTKHGQVRILILPAKEAQPAPQVRLIGHDGPQ